MQSHTSPEKLRTLADECRIDIINMIEKAASGHPGGSLSAIDLVISLFFSEMKIDPKNPLDERRDRFVMSKGHGVPALYATLAKLGILKKEDLLTLRQVDSKFQGHPDRVMMPIMEASTGSLGQGLSIAQGLALGQKLSKFDSRVFCMIGDGESQEGQIWEAAMSAPKFKLNNLVVILDNNNGQIDGYVEEVMDLRPLADKWRAFRWNVVEIDGHDFSQILGAFEQVRKEKEKPSIIIARTIKGKGVSFMENNIGWHGSSPNKEEAEEARQEIQKRLQG